MSERLRHAFVLAVVTALVLVSLLIVVGIPGVVKAEKTRLGIDLQGGTELIYLAHNTNGTPVNSTTLTDTINIMRSRSDTLGVSGVDIRPYGKNEITVDLPNVQNPTQAAKVVGVTGQLYFYDWEASVIGPNGQVAGPNAPTVTCDSATAGGGTPACGVTYYAAVIRASKQAAIPVCSSHLAKATKCFATESEPVPVYYYVDAKTQTVYAPAGPEPTKALLDADIKQHHVKLPAGAKLVEVQPGTVVVQATSAPEVLVPNDFYVLRDDVLLTGREVSNPQVTTDPTQGIAVSFGFKGNGASVFMKVTATLASRGKNNSVSLTSPNEQHFAVTLDGALVTVPSIDFTQYPYGIDASNGSEITGSFTYASATTLANVMASGALPVKLNEISSELISATLGHQALNQGLIAGLVGLALVALFLLIFYRVLGVIAVSALAIYALYLYALIKLVPVTLTLPGIAGLILTIGVAADANVVIFERVKEESRAGRSPLNAITAGYRRGFSAIVDANVVTFMAAFILFILSQSDVQGFALTLGMGVLVSLFTAVAATHDGSHTPDPRPKRPRRQQAPAAVDLRLHGQVALVLQPVGDDPAGRRDRDRRSRRQLRHRLRLRHPDPDDARAPGERERRDQGDRVAAPAQRGILDRPAGRAAGLERRQVGEAHLQLPDRDQDAERPADRRRRAAPLGARPARSAIRPGFGELQLGRSEFRQDRRRQCGGCDHRGSACDRGLYRAAFPVEVRGAGDDRVDA